MDITKLINIIGVDLYGRSRDEALGDRTCIKCDGSAVNFRDDISAEEYHLTGFCQACQDEIMEEAEY